MMHDESIDRTQENEEGLEDEDEGENEEDDEDEEDEGEDEDDEMELDNEEDQMELDEDPNEDEEDEMELDEDSNDENEEADDDPKEDEDKKVEEEPMEDSEVAVIKKRMNYWEKRAKMLREEKWKMSRMMRQVEEDKKKAVASKAAAENEVTSLELTLDEILQALCATSAPLSDTAKKDKERQRRDLEKELILARSNVAKSEIVINISDKRLASLKKDEDALEKDSSRAWNNEVAYSDLYKSMTPPVEDQSKANVSHYNPRRDM